MIFGLEALRKNRLLLYMDHGDIPTENNCPEDKLVPAQEATGLFATVQSMQAEPPSDPLEQILVNPEVGGELTLNTDASARGIGSDLIQKRADGSKCPISFLSMKFSEAAQKCSTIEQQFMVSKVVRWRLRLLEFDYVVKHIPGKENVVADALSRLLKVVRVGDESLDSAEILNRIHNTTEGHHCINRTLDILMESGVMWKNMSLEVSKFINLYATKSVTALEYAYAVVKHISIYGLPLKVRTDRGTQFTAEVSQQLAKLLNFQHNLFLTDLPSANGLVERPNAEFLTHLRAVVMEKRCLESWSINLPLVQRILNGSVNRSIGTYPSKLIFPHLPVQGPLLVVVP
jgi:hypothetical protein